MFWCLFGGFGDFFGFCLICRIVKLVGYFVVIYWFEYWNVIEIGGKSFFIVWIEGIVIWNGV